MVTIKCLKRIQDSTVNRKRNKGESFEVTAQRVKEMESSLGKRFKEFFEVSKIEKIKPAPKVKANAKSD
jgi:ferritin-like protein